jgi:Tlde1 domain
MLEWGKMHGGNMWVYRQITGELIRPDDTVAATGYAGGNGGQNPEGINNHDMQNIKNIGPIPVGYYTRGEVVLKSHLGPFAIPLIPDSDNEMWGRSGFYMHGDRADPPRSASDGCIIMPRAIREEFYASKDIILRVTA